MKKMKFIAIAVATLFVAASCVKDLNVTPIDPNTALPEDVLNNQDAFTSLLAKCYQGLASSASAGPDSSPDISGVDGGYGQYLRALVNMQDLTTDVMTCCWNDGNLFDVHNMTWNASNEFILSMYYRIFFQIGLCNEFIRQSNATEISDYTLKENYIAEARALRLLSYYHAIDMFGNVPFTDETSTVGSTGPEQIMRPDLFDWMEKEAKELLESSALAEPGKNEYPRADKGLVQMILAKLYLNAEVWAGTDRFADCAAMCEKIIAEYPLHPVYSDLFCADNHLWTANTTYKGDEIIFVSPQDGIQLRSYGSTNFLVFASTWNNKEAGIQMDAAAQGISSGWSGLSLTGTFTSKFDENDLRGNFYKGDGLEQYVDYLRDPVGASNGWKSTKFSNVNHDGTEAQAQGYVDTDFPLFRSADAYLMFAECAARNKADKTKGQNYLNAVRDRAGMGPLNLTLQNIIDERGRELYLEGVRRQDLIRFGLFTSDSYVWEFKGGVAEGKGVDDHFNLFPLTAGDVNANGNLTQNPGY